MTPFTRLSSSNDSLINDFSQLYGTCETVAEIIWLTPEYMYEKLTGKPFEQNNMNFIEANIHSIFLAVQNKKKNTFKKLFNFLSKDPVNQFKLLTSARQFSEEDSELEIYISRLLNGINLEYPNNNFNELKWNICNERLGTSLIFFKDVMGYEFHQDKADRVDDWIFDIFTAIEDGDIPQLEKLLVHAEFGNHGNIQYILNQALIMADTFNLGQSENSLLIKNIISESIKDHFIRADLFELSYPGYCKENDQQFISHLHKEDKEEVRNKTLTKTLMLLAAYPGRFFIPDQSHLQLDSPI